MTQGTWISSVYTKGITSKGHLSPEDAEKKQATTSLIVEMQPNNLIYSETL